MFVGITMKIDKAKEEILSSSVEFKFNMFIKDAPDDEVYTLKELSSKLDVNQSSLKNLLNRTNYPNTLKIGTRRIIGTKKSIEMLKKELNI